MRRERRKVDRSAYHLHLSQLIPLSYSHPSTKKQHPFRMYAGLTLGITVTTITLCILLSILVFHLRRQKPNPISPIFLLPPPVQTPHTQAPVQSRNIPSMPHITSPSTGPSSPLESPVVRTATMWKLRSVNGPGSGVSVVRLDENTVTRPQSAVVRASWPGQVIWQPMRVDG